MSTNNNDTNDAENRTTFDGVMVAVVNLDSLGAFLQNEISPEFISNVGLMDKNGTYTLRPKSIFGWKKLRIRRLSGYCS